MKINHPTFNALVDDTPNGTGATWNDLGKYVNRNI